jgi:hypothetical protein
MPDIEKLLSDPPLAAGAGNLVRARQAACVLMEDAAEVITSADVEAVESIRLGGAAD